MSVVPARRCARASALLLALVIALPAWAPPSARADAPAARPRTSSATWRTWLLPSADVFRAEAPPTPDGSRTRRELRELRRLQAERTHRRERLVRFWNEGAPTLRWTQVALDMIVTHRPPAFPTRTARALALLHIVLYDAMVAAFDSRAAYDRPRPARLDERIDPMLPAGGSSYPDVRSAIAGAAETMLTYLFPDEDPETFRTLATQAVRTRLWAGVNYRSDIETGREIGRQVAEVVIAWGKQDGSQDPWDFQDERLCSTARCTGADEHFWVPTPPAYQYPPTDPMASRWAPLLLDSPDAIRPGPPPEYGSPEFFAQAAAVKDANDASTPEDLELAFFWDDGPGTYSPGGHWNAIAMELVRERGLGMAQTARLFALMNVAIRDAFIACWDAKFAYWNIRPVTVIRERPTILGLPNPLYDPEWIPNIVTPPFPAYPSGHATESAAAARVLQYFFPDSPGAPPLDPTDLSTQGSIEAIADEVGRARLVGGIHFPIDNAVGIQMGRQIGGLAIAWAEGAGSA